MSAPANPSEEGATPLRTLADDALHRAAVRAERVVSALRACFCGAALARSLWLHLVTSHPGADARGAFAAPVPLLAVAFSIWMLQRARQPENVPVRVLVISVLVDVVGTTVALSSNVLWPWPSYTGILRLPETLTFVIVVGAACVRMLPALVLVAAASTSCGLAALVALDVWLNHPRLITDEGQVTQYLILMATVTTLGYVYTLRGAKLIREVTQLAYTEGNALGRLGSLMQDHHDATSLVSAALFSLERLSADPSATDAQRDLQADLRRLQESMKALKQRARGEVAALQRLRAVDLATALVDARALLERSVHPMRIDWALPSPPVWTLVAGGKEALERLVLNLLVNAREGSGTQGAATARVTVRRKGEHVHLLVEDDGPGLVHGWPGLSTKRGGAGMGCAFVQAVVSASRGRVSVQSAEHGTAVRIMLCRASAGAAPGLRLSELAS